MERTVVGIDVGSSKICTLVGEIGEGEGVRIVGVGLVPSRGIRKGAVVNVAEATSAIAASVDLAERTSGYKVERAYVGLSGTHISSLNSRGVVGISRREQGITPEDVERVLDAAHAIAVPHNQEIVHVIPRGYIVDGQSGVRDPVGMHGFRLEVEAHIVLASGSAIQNLVKCVESTGVEVDRLVLASVAAAESILTDNEREMGVVLADVGAGTTDLAIFIDGTVWHTVTLGIGGEYITRDIAICLRLPPDLAEQIKVEHGHADATRVSHDERFTITGISGEGRQAIMRWQLAEIIQARVEEIFSMIQQEIKRSGYDGLLPAGLVLCGGTAQMPGIQEVGREILGLPVRIGAPRSVYGLTDRISSPAHAVGTGLVSWGVIGETRPRSRKSEQGVGSRLLNWLRVFLP